MGEITGTVPGYAYLGGNSEISRNISDLIRFYLVISILQ